MFTVGIFTTHLPYIAFVFFYAFFFLIGIQNNSDENPVKEKHSLHSLANSSSDIKYEADSNYNIKNPGPGNPHVNSRIFSGKEIFEYYYPPNTCFYYADIQFELYSRPPPAK
jgi:hypothetical protein